MLEFEIARFEEQPASWEKESSNPYATEEASTCPEIKELTNRMFNKTAAIDGLVFHVGIKKTAPVPSHDSSLLFRSSLSGAIKRLDEFCDKDRTPESNFVFALDEHRQCEALIAEASRNRFGGLRPRRIPFDPPLQPESH